MRPNRCPSRLALDRHALGVKDEGVATHVAGCTACATHVRRASQPAATVPAWARELGDGRRRRGAAASRWWFGLLGAGGALAALGAWLVVAPRDAYVGTKGTAGAIVYIKHGETVAAWDGRAPLAPGDHIRLELAPTGHTRAHVLARAGAGAAEWTTLWAGAVDRKRATAVPAAWRVDAQPGPERLAIVAADAALTTEQAAQLLDRGCARAACVVITIPKAAPDGSMP